MNSERTISETLPSADDLGPERRHRTLAELAAEQGIVGPQDFEALCGAGADLWNDDAEFESFLASIKESRRSGE